MSAVSDLAVQQLAWGGPTRNEVDWLQAQGVPMSAIAKPWPIGAATVVFDGQRFDPSPAGTRAFTLPVVDCGEVVDIVAWQPKTNRLALYEGHAFCLGLDEIHNPATWFSGGALHVHDDPLQWLREDRTGIVILRPHLAYVHLANCPRISFDSEAMADKVRRWIEPPKPKVKFFLRRHAEAAE